jgi:hypothetical protein
MFLLSSRLVKLVLLQNSVILKFTFFRHSLELNFVTNIELAEQLVYLLLKKWT